MLHHKAFVKKTKKGGVVKVVREHYLRDDVPSGSPLDPACPPGAAVLSPHAPFYTVLDANVGLRQGDLLAHPAVNDLIIPGTALEEVRHRDAAAAARLRGLVALPGKRAVVFANDHARATWVGPPTEGESPNDRNDRAVRAVAAFYAATAAPGMGVVLVTDDAACRALASSDPACAGVTPLSSRANAARIAEAAGLPELAALVAAPGGGNDGEGGEEGGDAARGGASLPPSKRAARPRLFPDHLPLATITAGLAAGRLHQLAGDFHPAEIFCVVAQAADAEVGGQLDIGLPVADHEGGWPVPGSVAQIVEHQAGLGLAAVATVGRGVRAHAHGLEHDALRAEHADEQVLQGPELLLAEARGAEAVLVGHHNEGVADVAQLAERGDDVRLKGELVEPVDLEVGGLVDEGAVAVEEEDFFRHGKGSPRWRRSPHGCRP